ncbi:MAG: TonB-dependent receptor plug domain-containing protein [Saprospiraceae bacterium]|nr:TonB-dependent receptor plug domain-containing protein [Saprospiraceae bacterium]
MKEIVFSFFLLFGCISLTVAQRTISGKVTDSAGEALIGANVTAKGAAGTGTIADIDGMYSLKIPAGITKLVFSYTGYDAKEVTLDASNVINVVLVEGMLLDEVVVTALGIKRNAREVAYANQKVNSEELLSLPNKNTLEALRGKAAGVKITTASGSVGASSRIVLRGESSLTGNNNALIVVDGIPIDNNSTSGGSGQAQDGYADYGNRFNDINPSDIESVTVLKGPAATSVYGSRGAAGVVLVTTKKGGSGSKTNFKVGINSSYSREKAYVLLKRQDRFGQGYDNAHLDSGENWSLDFTN